MFCSHCGSALADGALFCSHCGQPVSEGNTNVKITTLNCPNCGGIINSFEYKCKYCGCEIKKTKTSQALNELTQKIEELTSKKNKPKAANLEQAADLIRNFPIPDNYEEQAELLIFAVSNIIPEAYNSLRREDSLKKKEKILSEAWISKYEQISQRLLLTEHNSEVVLRAQELYKEKKKQIKEGKMYFFYILFALIFLDIIMTLTNC